MTAIIASLSGLTPEWDIIKPAVTNGLAFYGNDARGHLASLIPANCQGIVSAGVCGGLDPALKRGALVVPVAVMTKNGSFITDGAWSTAVTHVAPAWRMLDALSVPDVWATDPKGRAALYAKTKCAIIDNETWAVAELAKERGVPFIVIRAVSDESDDTVVDNSNELNPDGTPNLPVDLTDFLHDPATVIHESVGFGQALDTLHRAVTALGPGLRFPR